MAPVLESDHVDKLDAGRPNFVGPVADVLDAVLFEQLESVVGESGVEIRKSSGQALVDAKFVKHRGHPLTSVIAVEPFLVLATQNPIDQEGTYPLPEAQKDRFMMKLNVNYPSKQEELKIMRRMTDLNFNNKIKTILTKKDITSIKNEINNVSVSESIEKYLIEIVFATRNPKSIGLEDAANYISFGASPRASINLVLASKANAFFQNRDYVTPEDVKEYIRYIAGRRLLGLGMKNIFHTKVNPLPWIDYQLNAVEHTNFFENRATEYAKASTTGNWQDIFK